MHMPEPATRKLRRVCMLAFSMVPAIASMYLLFWLERGEHWTLQTPWRDVMTIAILVIGLVGTFLLLSSSNRHRS
jgi:heme/copper-type cytochrome/quinol oxidase subunit 4